MKKFLIATTALVATAGVAAAEVKIGGDARFGLQYNSNAGITDNNWGASTTGSKTRLEKRMTLNIDGSTTADNGVTFGARVRIRSDEAAGSAVSGARVYARSGGLTVAVGNILGAIDTMPGLYGPSVGLTGLSWGGLVANVDRGAATSISAAFFDWDSFSSRGNGAEGIEAIYSMGDFAGHISYSSSKLGNTANAKMFAAHGAYTFSGWTVALGIQDSSVDAMDKIILTAGGKIGDFGVGVGYARNGKGVTRINKFAINGSYTMGATTISGYVANQSVLPVATGSKTSYGIGAAYNMGGGARIVGGIERTTRKTTRADVGVAFSF